MPPVQSDDDEPEDIDAFMDRRQREQAAQTPDAWAAANQAYGQAIRSGQDVGLQQPSDVLAYGASLSPGNGADSATSDTDVDAAPCPSPTQWQGLPEPLLQADTAIRAAANTLTFGQADHAAAAMDALLAPGGLDRWRQRYQADLQQEQARNQYDAIHRPVAQTAGSVGGGLLGLYAVGPMEGASAVAPRLAGAAQLTGRDGAAILGAGGATGVGTQALSDAANGHLSSPGDYAGSAIGGIAGAATALRLGPARAGAVDGAVSSAAQDFFNGRPVSVSQAADSALLGNVLGGTAGAAGRAWSNGLSKTEKGVLGERLGQARAAINGEQRVSSPKERANVDGLDKPWTNQKGSYWYPDGVDGLTAYEDKFGTNAALSPNQTRAQQNMGQNFRLNHFLPADIGRMTGLPAAQFAPQVVKQTQGQ